MCNSAQMFPSAGEARLPALGPRERPRAAMIVMGTIGRGGCLTGSLIYSDQSPVSSLARFSGGGGARGPLSKAGPALCYPTLPSSLRHLVFSIDLQWGRGEGDRVGPSSGLPG